MLNLYPIPGSVTEPDPGSGDFLTPGSGMNNPDHISESLETIFCLKKFKSFMQIRDGKNSDPGSVINIPDPQHCSILQR
jgi:hypothetical protein